MGERLLLTREIFYFIITLDEHSSRESEYMKFGTPVDIGHCAREVRGESDEGKNWENKILTPFLKSCYIQILQTNWNKIKMKQT